jgi:GNAT superfamily N-acetyltransferase
MTIFRPAHEADLREAYEVFYQNEVRDSPHPPPLGAIPPHLRHVLHTGAIYVAEQDGKVLAFAAAITRGNITFLTDLFVLPTEQSGQLGKMLLHAVLPQDGLVHCTVASSDPRALALYIRAGMRPQWPDFALRLEKPSHEWLLTPDMESIEADAADSALVLWDDQISGRMRPADLLYWVREQRAVPLWFRRQGQIVGYAFIRFAGGMLWDAQSCVLGPIGANAVQDATACVLAAIGWAVQQVDILRIDVPGPHPCLATLLERGFRIDHVDTFVSSADTPFFDACRYITSGGDLF